MTEDAILRSATLTLPVYVGKGDSTAETGKLMQEVARRLGNRVTTLVAQDPGNYNIDFAVTIQEIQK